MHDPVLVRACASVTHWRELFLLAPDAATITAEVASEDAQAGEEARQSILAARKHEKSSFQLA